MSTPKRYTPAQAAKILDVHANTVRAWCTEFADVLSDDATGRPRLLRDSDIATLQVAAAMRSEGISVPDVLVRLREIPAADRQSPTIDAVSTHVDASSKPTDDSTQLPAPVDVSALLTDLAVMVDGRVTQVADDVRRVDERLARVETQRSVWLGVAVGIAVGVVIGAIIVAVLVNLLR